MPKDFDQVAQQLASVAHKLYVRGWLLGTSGNLSAVIDSEPLKLAITPSGADKGELSAEQILLIDEHAKCLSDHSAKPSDESLLHVTVVQARGAGAVIHTHSVWATILSDLYSHQAGVEIEGYEMLKGLHGVTTHLHSEWIPIVDNSQDMPALAVTITEVLAKYPIAHAVLLRRHGLYTWGRDLSEAHRHAEILEFLLEAFGRTDEMRRANVNNY
jgi:methylthioribulose-1-phosphate dehydratase